MVWFGGRAFLRSPRNLLPCSKRLHECLRLLGPDGVALAEVGYRSHRCAPGRSAGTAYRESLGQLVGAMDWPEAIDLHPADREAASLHRAAMLKDL